MKPELAIVLVIACSQAGAATIGFLMYLIGRDRATKHVSIGLAAASLLPVILFLMAKS